MFFFCHPTYSYRLITLCEYISEKIKRQSIIPNSHIFYNFKNTVALDFIYCREHLNFESTVSGDGSQNMKYKF